MSALQMADAAGVCQASQCLHCKIFIGQMSGQRGTISAIFPGSMSAFNARQSTDVTRQEY